MKKFTTALFKALHNFEVLKKEFEDLEFLVFMSGKSYNTRSVEYRLNTWKSRVESLDRFSKLCHYRTLKDLDTREISIRSRLIKIEEIEKEIEENV